MSRGSIKARLAGGNNAAARKGGKIRGRATTALAALALAQIAGAQTTQAASGDAAA